MGWTFEPSRDNVAFFGVRREIFCWRPNILTTNVYCGKKQNTLTGNRTPQQSRGMGSRRERSRRRRLAVGFVRLGVYDAFGGRRFFLKTFFNVYVCRVKCIAVLVIVVVVVDDAVLDDEIPMSAKTYDPFRLYCDFMRTRRRRLAVGFIRLVVRV